MRLPSSNPDKGNVISFSWEQLSPKKPIVTIDQNSPNSPKATFQAPIVDKDTLLTIRLTVKDNNGGKATDLVKVLVKNQAIDKENPALENQGQQQIQEQQQSQTTSTNSQVPTPSKENNNSDNSGNVGANHAPIATGTSVSADQNNPMIISLKATDSDIDDKLTFLRLPGSPTHGIIAGFNKDTGSLTYIPINGFTGEDAIKFKVIDSHGAESNVASVSISVAVTTTTIPSTQEEPPNTTTQIPPSLSPSPSNTSTTTVTTPVANTSSAKSLTSELTSSVSDKLKERLAEIEAKIKETRGQKIANQYIVVLKSDLSSSKAQAVANDAKGKHGAKLLYMYQKAIKGFTISVPNQQALDAILNSSDVAYAEPDVKVKTFAQGGGEDQILPTGIDRVDGDLSVAASGDGKGDNINADVAVLDSGIDLSHPDLNVYKELSFVPGTTSGNDDNGHGTMVAGIIGAKDNNFGVVGIAPGVRLWAIKVLDRYLVLVHYPL